MVVWATVAFLSDIFLWPLTSIRQFFQENCLSLDIFSFLSPKRVSVLLLVLYILSLFSSVLCQSVCSPTPCVSIFPVFKVSECFPSLGFHGWFCLLLSQNKQLALFKSRLQNGWWHVRMSLCNTECAELKVGLVSFSWSLLSRQWLRLILIISPFWRCNVYMRGVGTFPPKYF